MVNQVNQAINCENIIMNTLCAVIYEVDAMNITGYTICYNKKIKNFVKAYVLAISSNFLLNINEFTWKFNILSNSYLNNEITSKTIK